MRARVVSYIRHWYVGNQGEEGTELVLISERSVRACFCCVIGVQPLGSEGTVDNTCVVYLTL